MLAAIALAFAAEGNDGDAIGAGTGGGERGQRTPDARLRERPHAAFGGDLDRFHQSFVAQSRLNRQYQLMVWSGDGAVCSIATDAGSPTESALPQPTVAKHVTLLRPPKRETSTRFFISTAVAIATTVPWSASRDADSSSHCSGSTQNQRSSPLTW
jgi:hypothetical protein